ncbi:hypothetical protein [Sulfitobacter pontiacus]|uniref:hypothetical protein n=1 Tax=Sulfitobacter pontiacus TaxID=60137 RepID=UPI0015DF938F|nr:hypothetical protein [Sulfitobacter pontiacus]QLL42818.1 hypothetical protein G6548_09855 [Sulfitobacter pontiacus]
MTTSSQTTANLKSIIETLDQRIHELSKKPSAAIYEVGQLNALRKKASNLLTTA